MVAELIDTWSALELLQPQWRALLADSAADSLFLTWEWVQAWSSLARGSVQPFLVVVRDDEGVPLGIAPFYLTWLYLLSCVPLRTLRIVADYATGAEYGDWIIRRGHERTVSAVIAETLHRLRSRWDCIWMPNVAGWTGAVERLTDACRAVGFSVHARPRDFAAVDLPEEHDTFLRRMSAKARQNLRADARRVEACRDLRLRRCGRVEDVPAFLDALFELHHRRWQRQQDEGTFRRKPEEACFYRRFVPVALQQGWLRLAGLEDGGGFRAVQIGYVYKGTMYSLQGGFDPDSVKGIRNALRSSMIAGIIEEGVRVYDFLGEMTEHKRRWLAHQRLGADLFIGRPGALNRLLFLADVWPSGRLFDATHPWRVAACGNGAVG